MTRRKSPLWLRIATTLATSPLLVGGLVCLCLTLILWLGLGEMRRQKSERAQEVDQPVAYVDDQLCADCHADQVAAWQASHHAQAMQPATDLTVLGDFNNAHFADAGITAHFSKKDGKFFINTLDRNGQPTEFEVKYTFGIDPLQQYLVLFPNGRLQAFTVAWDTIKQQWFNLYPNERIAPDNPLHWTNRHFIWNSACAECHSTNVQLNYDQLNKRYATTWAAINVGCQACHGPGAAHLQWAQSQDASPQPDGSSGLVVDFQAQTATQHSRFIVESCAPCHARRYPISTNDQAGEPFLDHFMPELLQEGLYYADGQIQDEVFEYGSFVQSKMYQQGVSCVDCHNPHTLELRQPGNALCTACHQPQPPTTRFKSLPAKNYDSPAHHFHQPDSPGAQCVNCHMPSKPYMVVDPRRDHSLRIPRPDLSVQLNTPNACTGCHTDQDAPWAVAAMTAWYGSQWQARPHFAATLAAGRRSAPEALAGLSHLAQDAIQPVIVRATALDLLRGYGAAGAPPLLASLTDSEPLLRATAARTLGIMPVEEVQNALMPLLQDPRRAVRIAAAQTVAALPQTPALAASLAEYEAAQLAVADQPEGHANLGALYTVLGQWDRAEQAYKQALAHDAYFTPAYSKLAQLYAQTARAAAAQEILEQGLTLQPEQGELYYALGLLLVGQQDQVGAVTALAKAAALLPDHPRVYYNYGLLLQQTGQIAQAESALRHAVALRPADLDILYAISVFYLKQSQPTQAQPYVERLVQLAPTDPRVQQLVQTLHR